MQLVSQEAIFKAAEMILEHLIACELDDADSTARLPESIHSPAQLAEVIIETDPVGVALVFGRLIGRIEGAWGQPVGLILHHMDLTEDKLRHHATFLYLVLMSCSGEGVGIEDDYMNEFDRAGQILCNVVDDLGKRFDPSPIDYDSHECLGHFLDCLVYEGDSVPLNSVGTEELDPFIHVHRSEDGKTSLCGVPVTRLDSDTQRRLDMSTTCGECVEITGAGPCVDCNAKVQNE